MIESIMKRDNEEIFRISYVSKTNSIREAYVAIRYPSYVNKSQLLHMINVKAERSLKDFKKLNKGK